MGRVLLAALPVGDLEAYLRATELVPLTDRTIADTDRLRTELEAVRRQGFALVDQELEGGVRSIAVPVHDAAGHVVAAVNASAHAARVPLARLREEFLPRLRACADAIDADLRAHR
jgi:IclR family pca regulon transcriptional regulator